MSIRDPMPDEHRYHLDWGPPNAEELRNRRRRIAATLDGPHRGKPGRWSRFWRFLGSLVGVQ